MLVVLGTDVVTCDCVPDTFGGAALRFADGAVESEAAYEATPHVIIYFKSVRELGTLIEHLIDLRRTMLASYDPGVDGG